MTQEQVSEKIMEMQQAMAAQGESIKNAHRRIDENDALTAQIHKLATSIETLAVQLKMQGNRMDKLFNGVDDSLKRQGERIGVLEKKPAKKWESVTGQAIGLVVAAIVGMILTKIGLGGM